MFYFLSLEVVRKINKGATVITSDIPFGMSTDESLDINHRGTLWNGKRVLKNLGEEFEIGDITDSDIYEIAYSIALTSDTSASEASHISEELHFAIDDLLEYDLMAQWSNLDVPSMFLMWIEGHAIYTDIGTEYDTINESVRVVTQEDLSAIAQLKANRS